MKPKDHQNPESIIREFMRKTRGSFQLKRGDFS
jgi:hypothetical protein